MNYFILSLISLVSALTALIFGGLVNCIGIIAFAFGLVAYRKGGKLERRITIVSLVLSSFAIICFALALVPATEESQDMLTKVLLTYHSHYGEFPNSPYSEKDVILQVDSNLVRILEGSNPHSVPFIVRQSDSIRLVDYWSDLNVKVDANNDGKIIDPVTGKEIRKRVLVWRD